MILAFLGVLTYGMLSLSWAPDASYGLHDFVTIGIALSTGIALMLLVRGDGRVLGAFAGGLLIAGMMQVGIALVEVTTGKHVSLHFGSSYVEAYGLSSVETLFGGAVAWGTMGNPNDLGGLLLLASAVFYSVRAYGLRLRRSAVVLGFAATAVAVWIGLTALADARAYRWGLIVIVGMHVIDYLLPPRRFHVRVVAILLLGWGALALTLTKGGSMLGAIVDQGGSDALRLALFSEGISSAFLSGGFGLGLGAEAAMTASGKLPLNFHNVVGQLAAELGLVVAALFLWYLLSLLASWVFATGSARAIGREAALARATLASALLFYGVTSSGVLESPVYWACFAATACLTATCSPVGQVDAVRRHGPALAY